jgi:hypothetical protein
MTASACSPNGVGCRFSLFGLLGLTAAKDEGLETKILELSDGADFFHFALKFPGVGHQ